jgi:hypothetical protein
LWIFKSSVFVYLQQASEDGAYTNMHSLDFFILNYHNINIAEKLLVPGFKIRSTRQFLVIICENNSTTSNNLPMTWSRNWILNRESWITNVYMHCHMIAQILIFVASFLYCSSLRNWAYYIHHLSSRIEWWWMTYNWNSTW